MKPYVYPYKMNSVSAKVLSKALSCKKVFPNRKYKPLPDHLVINWGSGTVPNWEVPNNILNHPNSVKNAVNKLTTFRLLEKGGVSIPEFTTDPSIAYEWCREHPHKPEIAGFARTILNGTKGKGIVPFYHATEYGLEGEPFPVAKLYVKYIKKQDEYRVHIFNGKIIDVQQKKRRKGFEGVNNHIRNHHNGWVFCRNEIEVPQVVLDEALKAVTALGLHFGGVDVVWNNFYQKAYVLEVNTAPGLVGSSIEIYANAIRELL